MPRPITIPALLHQTTKRAYSSLPSLESELPSRALPVLHDHLTPQPSYLLSTTLSSFLPQNSPLAHPPSHLPSLADSSAARLPEGHHLIYFPPPLSLPSLLPDGTDPAHSPGPPFTRRMWAGGRLNFRPDRRLTLDGRRAVCVEGIRDVRTKKGRTDDEEKVFVGIERRILGGLGDEEALRLGDEGWRQRLWGKTGEVGEEEASVLERRELVFMRDPPRDTPKQTAAEGKPTKVVKAPHPPTVSHTLLPSPHLLFRFSALTFNAHAIHLDKGFCRDAENHRNLLVHGPLSLVFLLSLLRGHVLETKGPGWMVTGIEYRNLAPLYAEEELRLCARATGMVSEGGNEGEEAWDVWIEGPEGGMCVRGKAKVGKVT
ncbi:MAG: Mg(2+) transporter [Chaenotheca gracillima]|nr:MAG: Mg(2+) transporter [Chaenotheca gracillima]